MLRILLTVTAIGIVSRVALESVDGPWREMVLIIASFCAGAVVAVQIHQQRFQRALFEYELRRNAKLDDLAEAQVEQASRVVDLENRIDQGRR
jgi:hypothetical protein